MFSFLAHGGCPKSASWTFRIGKSTIYALIPEVCRVIAQELVHRYVQFPNRKKWLNIAEDFQLNSHFPNCLGALDGKHIRVEKPANAGATCKNYKKFHSLILMAMCDSKRRFTWFNFGDFGKLFVVTNIYFTQNKFYHEQFIMLQDLIATQVFSLQVICILNWNVTTQIFHHQENYQTLKYKQIL